MDKMQRNERIAVLMKLLSDSPGQLFTLGSFTEMFGSAKSTVSEDIDILEKLLKKFEMGSIETTSGASGGVKFFPCIGKKSTKEIVEALCNELSKNERILPGGYLFMQDVIYDPVKVSQIGRIFSAEFYTKEVDYVITVETKGIPLAFITAKYLNVPLVIARHYNEATDGASVNINYVSGSSKKIQTMVLPIKAVKRNSRILFIDDFMKAGGTAKGIIDLAKEFESEVVGIGVLVGTAEPEKKLVEQYFSLLTLNSVDEENGVIDINPSIL